MSYRVFIVEDHDVVRDNLAMLIKLSAGLSVSGCAATAEEALEQIAAKAPDVLLVDIALPGMSGLELVEHLSEAGTLPPTIMVTGHDYELYRQKAKAAGAQGFITKDRIIDTLIREIRRVAPKEAGRREASRHTTLRKVI